MADWIYLLFIPALLMIVWLWPNKKPTISPHKTAPKPQPHQQKQHEHYHAVSIQPCAHACRAVLALHGKRFLAEEAVSLPLPDCDATKCTCTYKHHIDRRQGYDRRHDSIDMEDAHVKDEHRSNNAERRKHPQKTIDSRHDDYDL